MTDTFRAAVCCALNGPDGLELRDLRRDELPSNSVRIAVKPQALTFPTIC